MKMLSTLVSSFIGVFACMPTYAENTFKPSYQDKSFQHPLYPVTKPREEGYLQVSDTHKIFYAAYGNPEGIPVVVLHGGPGGGCSDGMSSSFDLKRWNVIMFDQRGALRSTPFGCMEENSPQHSIQDIEKLREHFGIEKWAVFGGSWGSSLALLYGQAYPERCTGFILRGMWLVREQDYQHLFYTMGKVFPESYADVVNLIPEEERHDLIAAYARRVKDPDPAVHMPATRAFMRFDFVAATHLPSPAFVDKMMQNEELCLSVMRAFCHYAENKFFLEPNQILNNMLKINHLPAIIINGRWDAICPSEMAYLVHQEWKSNSALWIVSDGGHSPGDPSIGSALATATDLFIERLSTP